MLNEISKQIPFKIWVENYKFLKILKYATETNFFFFPQEL